MNIVQVATLAFMQGFTELLPISSSGYMIIASWALGWDPPSSSFDATVHLGSVLALALFFRRDWMLILRTLRRGRNIPLGGDDDLMSMQTLEKHRRIGDIRRRLSMRMSMPSKNLVKAVGLGSLPALAIGAATYQAITSETFRAPEVAAGMFIVTGGALLLGHHFTNPPIDWQGPPDSIESDRLHRRIDHRLRPGRSIDTRHIQIGGNDHCRIDARHAFGCRCALLVSAIRARDSHRVYCLIRSSPSITIRIIARLGRTRHRFRDLFRGVVHRYQPLHVAHTPHGDADVVAVRRVYRGDRGDCLDSGVRGVGETAAVRKTTPSLDEKGLLIALRSVAVSSIPGLEQPDRRANCNL